MQENHVVAGGSGRPVFRLRSAPTPADLSELRTAVVEAVGEGVACLTIDLNEVGVLDSHALATLLAIRRELGERRAELVLRCQNERVRDTLRITGLDRVFALDAAGPLVTGRRRRAGAWAVALLAAGFALGTPGRAAEGDPAALVTRLSEQNSEMRSYQARISVDVQMRNFPYVSVHLNGTTYFKRPDNYEVVFEKVPTYAKGFDRLYSDIGDPSSWPSRFTMSVAGEKTVNGHSDVIVRLVQKVRGMIDHEDVAIDPVTARIDNMEWHYYNGGLISMSQDYETVGAFSVLARQRATIRIPYFHASAEAAYTNYHTNVAIDDSVFTKEKH